VAHLDAFGGEIGQFGDVTRAGHDFGGAARQQFLDREAAKLTTGTGDQQGLILELGHVERSLVAIRSLVADANGE
jgi:hypothetical protein